MPSFAWLSWFGLAVALGCAPEPIMPPGPRTYHAQTSPKAATVVAKPSPSAEAATESPTAKAAPPPAPSYRVRSTQRGLATYYADSLAGNKTASGEIYRPALLTAAHRKLPFGTKVRVVRLSNGRSVVVTINDRGPFAGKGRIIDLSRAAAERLQMIRAGVVEVRIEVLSP